MTVFFERAKKKSGEVGGETREKRSYRAKG